ncbi:MAG: putative glycoside hydrolase [Endomicrobium sp.]|nr:putative glycoside hydrolase [Endomicrobium sp.]
MFSACSSVNPVSNVKVLEYPQDNQTITDIAYGILNRVTPQEQPKKKYARGIHLTAFISAVNKHRSAAIELFDDTELNTAVIDIKELEGQVYMDGVKTADANGASFARALPNLDKYIKQLKEKEIYTIARIVVFRDNLMPRKKTKWAVKKSDGSLWTDRKGITWLDPYNQEAWDYAIEIAQRAADLGFDEIQFDYIRFPSDGNIASCRYLKKEHTKETAAKALVGFLEKASEKLKEKNVKISIDVFGLTTTADDDMGIGQKIVEMAQYVDYVSPMVYPSHYNKGAYGIDDPNKNPYKTVYKGMEGAIKKLPAEKMRPWLQDFTMGFKYDKEQVRAQIQACYDNGIGDWLLWNPRCVYTRGALKDGDAETSFEKSNPPTPEMLKTEQNKQKENEKSAGSPDDKPEN